MRLNLPAGPAPRLLAPGEPDWIGTDGERVGWVMADVLFVLDAEGVTAVPLGDLPDDVAAAGGRWSAAIADGVVRVEGQAAVGAVLIDEYDPVHVLPGVDCALAVAAPSHELLRTRDGARVPIPDAATRAKFAAPFQVGVGLCWIDLEVLYRLGEGGLPNALGRAGGAEAIAVGPRGSCLVQLAGDTLVAPTRALAQKLGEKLDVATARFSIDGESALVADEDGVVLLDLRANKVSRRWDGALTPVGFAPAPLLLDRDLGALVDAGGHVILDGFGAATASCKGAILAGPGGTTWRLDAGERLPGPPYRGVTATDGDRVIVVDDEAFTVDSALHPHGLCSGDDFVARAAFDGDEVLIQTIDGETGAFGLDGSVRWRRRDEAMPDTAPPVPEGVVPGSDAEPSEFSVDGVRYPLPGTAFARAGGRTWAWSDEGFLVEL